MRQVSRHQPSLRCEQHWHALAERAVLGHLHASRTGLTSPEAAARLRQYGGNVLPPPQRIHGFAILLNQLKSPVVLILLFAMALTVALRQFLDLAVIAAVMSLNTLVGFTQERRATRTFESLQQLVTFRARVIRDGRERSLPSEALVPGDLITVRAGDRVPADARLLHTSDLTVVEASLTGESTPSKKSPVVLPAETPLADRENMVYLGTTAVTGVGAAVVCATGGATAMGQIVHLVQQTEEPQTPLEGKMRQLAKQLTVIVCAVAALVVVLGLLQGRPLLAGIGAAESSILYVAVALAVSAIPEGLPVIVTVILAIGMRRIARHGALVHRLNASETLGSTSVICTDKTGTITEGQMQILRLITADEHAELRRIVNEPRDAERMLLLKIAVLCNDAVVENPDDELQRWRLLGDPTETALLKSAAQVGVRQAELQRLEPRLDELPFSSETMCMATLHRMGDQRIVYLKGSPEAVLQRCRTVEMLGKVKLLNGGLRRRLQEAYELHSRHGLRLLGMAYRFLSPSDRFTHDVAGYTLVGFVGLKDPLRPEAKEAFAMTSRAGIRTVMVTGDHPLTAVAIAQELGMQITPSRVMVGEELERLTSEELAKNIHRIDIFARVSPRHKLQIISAWQRRGEVVAMTGDGVNDAPALQAADIGIALNSGSDVAKETADLILLEDNFRTIATVVEQGRVIFDNIRKAVLYLLSDSMTEVALVSAAMISGLPLPLLPAQILWINLIDDGLPAIALTAERGEAEVMDSPPRRRGDPVLDTEIKTLIAVISLVFALLLFLLFVWLLSSGAPIRYVRTIMFTELALNSLFYVFSIRNLHHPVGVRSVAGNPQLFGAVAVGFLLQLAAVYEPHLQRVFQTVPLAFSDWVLIVGLSMFVIGVIEVTKWRFFSRPQSHGTQRANFSPT